jgi:hypothetical protein
LRPRIGCTPGAWQPEQDDAPGGAMAGAASADMAADARPAARRVA